MGGLWKPLDHEKSLRRDKSQKGDYRDGFHEPISQKLSSSSFSGLGLRLTSRGLVRTPTWYREVGRRWKQKIKVEIRRITNKFPISIDGRRFAFKWTVVEFARANSLTEEKAKIIFPEVKAQAIERRNMVELRLSRAEVVRGTEYDPESRQDVWTLSLDFSFNDVAKILPFADEFKIEEEFFAIRDKAAKP